MTYVVHAVFVAALLAYGYVSVSDHFRKGPRR